LCHPLNVPGGGQTARFIEPMLLLRTEKLPEGAGWQYEVKFDGYRALAIKCGGSRRAGFQRFEAHGFAERGHPHRHRASKPVRPGICAPKTRSETQSIVALN